MMRSSSSLYGRSIVLLFVLLLLSSQPHNNSHAAVICSTDEECAAVFHKASTCSQEGTCTNPLHYGGCLSQMMPDRLGKSWYKLRVCGSEDPPEAERLGYCRQSPLDYTEVRIASQNWISGFITTWIMQIFMSEILDIPVSVETGEPNSSVDFYSESSRFDYGLGYQFDALARGKEVGDCHNADASSGSDTYKSCAHVMPEMWPENHKGVVREMHRAGSIFPPTGSGALGLNSFFVPDRTARKHPDLLSHFGLSVNITDILGRDKRRLLAETFQRPTTWGDYCNEVSPDACATPDAVATRSPAPSEEGRYFVEGVYTGYFRATEESDCDLHPDTCTGVFIDYPCAWNYNTFQKLHWLGIPLEPVNFDFGDIQDVMLAANATGSDVIQFWYEPDPMNELFQGTDSEFVKVSIPRATPQCVENKMTTSSKQCLVPLKDKEAGAPEGACEQDTQILQMVRGTSLVDIGENPEVNRALWSPARQSLELFEITNSQFSSIFEAWIDRDTDKLGYGLRDATCRWVVDNLDVIQNFVPESFPRTLRKKRVQGSLASLSAFTLSSLAVLLMVGAAWGIYRRRTTKIMYHTQLGLSYTIIAGLLLVAVGAVTLALPASTAVCVSHIWLINMGYVLELFAIAAKVDAINSAVRSGKHMQRVRLTGAILLRSIGLAASLVGCFVLVWTFLDQPSKMLHYELTADISPNGETIVATSCPCESNSNLWYILGLSWQLVVVLYGFAMASVAGRVREDMNGARNLASIMAGHVVFLIFRSCLYAMRSTIDVAYFSLYESVLLSIDCIVAVSLFSVPKIFGISEEMSDEVLPDLFVETTVLVADVVGFTKWSSMREPMQVFKLLETLFSEFDRVAEKRKVFKVETVGDCYVAASGIPHPQSDHALIMAKFAIECMMRMQVLASELEVVFGPDTGDLSLRIGIHSGTITGGFLKGKGSRFQLFGDTMNTVGRMESSGEPGMIHVSEAFAELLRNGGHSRCLTKRDDKVYAKGKGELQTYWLAYGSTGEMGDYSSNPFTDLDIDDSCMKVDDSPEAQQKRLIQWNVMVLLESLKRIVALRRAAPRRVVSDFAHQPPGSKADMPLEEVKEIINLPEFDGRLASSLAGTEHIKIPANVTEQLGFFVTSVAEMYRDNPFHNFAHASHVVMAVRKYLNRISSPAYLEKGKKVGLWDKNTAEALHEHTYGITSDPLTHFACIFAALIHDLDHPGVPNAQLMREKDPLNLRYKKRSVAEQNSFDLAWALLMEPAVGDFCKYLCETEAELARFRQLTINAIMATDLGDKELKALRNDRWDKAFSTESSLQDAPRDIINRKATIVIEHVIQAADVAHTMQHWHVFRQWNERLFTEMYRAWKAGRAERNPAEFWYEGETGFLDNYIIPLSEKLRDCGVFGVSSDENLSYAKANRAEWIRRGREVVAEMEKKMEQGNSMVKSERVLP